MNRRDRASKSHKKELQSQLAEYFEVPSPKGKRAFVRQLGLQRISMLQMIFMQGRYISPLVWLFSFVLFGLAVCAVAYVDERFVKGIYACIPFLVMFSVTECTRSYRYGMEELEMSARFSLKGTMLAKMMLLGIGNLAVLLGTFLVLGDLGQGEGACMLTPYFLTASGGLWIVRKIRGNESMILCFGFAGLISILSLYLPWQFRDLFAPQNVGLWILACGVAIFLAVRESYRIIRMAEGLV